MISATVKIHLDLVEERLRKVCESCDTGAFLTLVDFLFKQNSEGAGVVSKDVLHNIILAELKVEFQAEAVLQEYEGCDQMGIVTTVIKVSFMMYIRCELP